MVTGFPGTLVHTSEEVKKVSIRLFCIAGNRGCLWCNWSGIGRLFGWWFDHILGCWSCRRSNWALVSPAIRFTHDPINQHRQPAISHSLVHCRFSYTGCIGGFYTQPDRTSLYPALPNMYPLNSIEEIRN